MGRAAVRPGPMIMALVLGIASLLTTPPARSSIGSTSSSAAVEDGKILFWRNHFDPYNAEIHSIDADGTNQVNLTNHPAGDFDPSWSPDGTKFAFESDRAGSLDIFVMNADGSGLTQLTSDPPEAPVVDWQPAWSPDGSQIAFIRDQDVWVMEADGSDPVNLTKTDTNEGGWAIAELEVAWSPDGTRLSFIRVVQAHGDLFVMNADGTNEVLLSDAAFLFAGLDWSPDGSKIAFGRRQANGSRDIWTINPDGTGLTQLTNTFLFEFDPTWSPTGDQIAFSGEAVVDGQNIGFRIFKMNADGSDRVLLTTDPGIDDYAPDWVGSGEEPPPPPPSGSLVGLGDSIAAGHGLGNDGNGLAYPHVLAEKLGLEPFNYAISGACAATHAELGADPRTPDTCKESVLNTQLTRVSGSPRLITLTVGANDIQFSKCFQAKAFKAVGFAAEDDPCSGGTFQSHLGALASNLASVLSKVKERFPMAKVVLTKYYQPFPAPALDDSEICPVYEPLAVQRNPRALLDDGLLNRIAGDIQNSLWSQTNTVLSKLNKTIQNAANKARVSTVPLRFSSHDFCQTLAGGSVEDTWVYGPKLDVSVQTFGLIETTRSWSYTLPDACLVPREGDETIYHQSGSGGRFGIFYSWAGTFQVNCAPHPTQNGQEAIATAIESGLGDFDP
jgi:Tol biopolymer transport system component/lysophospholipase L1-like esterase